MADYNLDLVKYRLEFAKDFLESAELSIGAGKYKRSLSDSYYAMFTSARAVLAKDGVDFKRHSGVISYIQKEYVKTGIFDVKYSKYLMGAFLIRGEADYADFFVVSKVEAEEQYNKAVQFYEMISGYLAECISG